MGFGCCTHRQYPNIKMIKIPTTKELHKLFSYKNGFLYWKVDMPHQKKIGSVAGSLRSGGHDDKRHWGVQINGTVYAAHRLIWVWHGKKLKATDRIKHVNGDVVDNRIENLMLLSSAAACRGVYKATCGKKWVVMFSINGKTSYFGTYSTVSEAKRKAKEVSLQLAQKT